MITTLTGSNSFLLQQELQKRVQAFLEEYGDMGLERLDGEEAEFGRMREALEGLPFLAGKKLVILRRPGANKEFSEQFESLLERIPEVTDVLIVEPQVDKRSVYYKALKKHTELIECNELDENGLAKWLAEYVKVAKGVLSFADARYLVERVGANQQLLSQEINKLLSYDPKISRESIDLLTEETPQSTIFQLLDAAFAGHTKRALELYEQQRKQKVEAQQILAMLAWQLHVLALIKTAGERSANDIAQEAKINPFVVRKSMSIANKMSRQQLEALIAGAVQLDIDLKTTAIDADDALKQLLIDIGDTK